MHRLPFVLLGLTACGSPTPVVPATPQDDSATPAVFTAMFESNCGDCHWAPDPGYAVDRAWITQLADTAWSTQEPEARAAFAKWFESTPLPLPEVYDGGDTSPEPGSGTIETNIERGALFLQNVYEEQFRLSWEDSPSQSAGRVIPAGDYEITGYRIAARDESGVEWFLAATQPFMRELEVIDGETLHIEIDPRIQLTLKSSDKVVNVMVQGDEGAGMTIYRQGRRIPLDFKVTAPNGNFVTQGSFEYG